MDDTDMTIEDFNREFDRGVPVRVVATREIFQALNDSHSGTREAAIANYRNGSQVTPEDRRRNTYVVSNRDLACVGNFTS